MPLLSEVLQGQTEAERRRLYSLFARATKQGQLTALKLLTRFELTNTKGQPRAVADYAYPSTASTQVEQWLTEQTTSAENKKGVTAEQAQAMSDDELSAAIKASRTKRRTTKTRKPKATAKAS